MFLRRRTRPGGVLQSWDLQPARGCLWDSLWLPIIDGWDSFINPPPALSPYSRMCVCVCVRVCGRVCGRVCVAECAWVCARQWSSSCDLVCTFLSYCLSDCITDCLSPCLSVNLATCLPVCLSSLHHQSQYDLKYKLIIIALYANISPNTG